MATETVPKSETSSVPDDICYGAVASAAPWNAAPHRPYRLPPTVKVLGVREGASATGIQVLVETGDELLGQRWMDAAWFRWEKTKFL